MVHAITKLRPLLAGVEAGDEDFCIEEGGFKTKAKGQGRQGKQGKAPMGSENTAEILW